MCLALYSGVSWRKLLWRALPRAKRLLPGQLQRASPKPIPGGIQHPLSGQSRLFHVFLPGHGNEPSTITDFEGFIGLAHLTGSGNKTNMRTGSSARLLFDADIRFMKGAYIDVKGRNQEGVFGCICLNLFEGQMDVENQVHHFAPGINRRGLFWTTPIPPESVRVIPDAGIASMDVTNLKLRDFYNVPNGLRGGQSAPVTVSLHVKWSGIKQRVRICDRVDTFDGQFIEHRPTLEWSAQQTGFTFVSDPAPWSRSTFGIIGYEHNGRYLKRVETGNGADWLLL